MERTGAPDEETHRANVSLQVGEHVRREGSGEKQQKWGKAGPIAD